MTRADVTRFLSFHPFTGAHMALVICTFFGVVITVNLFMATMATRSWTGLIAKNGYIASEQLKARADREAGARAAGWRIEAVVDGGEVRILALDGGDAPIERAEIAAFAERPVMDRDDRPLPLRAVGAGRYVAAEPLPVGRWYVDVTVLADDLELTRRFSVTVDG